MAENYLDYLSFSRSGLIEQLKIEGFSNEHATHAVDEVGL
ncbi:Ltp family lipoprotein [Ornithinibacillus sp. 4-3]|uniref:Ltp family lipoprotein n=1 Tax=Ornithinibacillus sp. 4-3 TaxID=3231488 RepID=A0AB39HH50_9BACI